MSVPLNQGQQVVQVKRFEENSHRTRGQVANLSGGHQDDRNGREARMPDPKVKTTRRAK